MHAHEIDRALVRTRAYGHVVPTHIRAWLEIRKTVLSSEAPQIYIDACHAQLRWSAFCTTWAILGAQLRIEEVVRCG